MCWLRKPVVTPQLQPWDETPDGIEPVLERRFSYADIVTILPRIPESPHAQRPNPQRQASGAPRLLPPAPAARRSGPNPRAAAQTPPHRCFPSRSPHCAALAPAWCVREASPGTPRESRKHRGQRATRVKELTNSSRRLNPLAAATGGIAVPRTHLLANVAAEDLPTHLLAQLHRNLTLLLDRQVCDAQRGVHLTRCDQRAGRARIDAARARSAAIRRTCQRRLDRQRCHNHCQQQPRPKLLVQHAGILANPADACPCGEIALQHRPGCRHSSASRSPRGCAARHSTTRSRRSRSSVVVERPLARPGERAGSAPPPPHRERSGIGLRGASALRALPDVTTHLLVRSARVRAVPIAARASTRRGS